MKKITIIFSITALLAASGCQKDGLDEDLSFLNSATTNNNNKVFEITDDNSGLVTITPTGEGATSYTVNFGHGTGADASAIVNPGYSATHAYPEGTYTVTIISKSMSGQESSADYPLQVTYRAPENINVTTTTNVHNIKVKADALYAASYLVYFGDVANEVGTPLANGAEASHDYADAGTYDVKVVALSGGAAKSEKTTPVVIYDAFGLPISFDLSTINYFFGTFGGGQQFATVDNPSKTGINTSNKVGKFTRGWEGWSGTYSPLNTPIDMAQGKVIKVMVYNPDPALIGKKLNVELEAGPIDNGIAVLKTALTKSGEWEELTFNYSGIAAIPSNAKFNQLVLRFADDVEGDAVGGVNSVIYLDNFRQTN